MTLGIILDRCPFAGWIVFRGACGFGGFRPEVALVWDAVMVDEEGGISAAMVVMSAVVFMMCVVLGIQKALPTKAHSCPSKMAKSFFMVA